MNVKSTLLLAVFMSASAVAVAPSNAADLGDPVERVEFTNVPLQDVLRLLAEGSDVNLVASEEAAGKNITVFLQNIALRDAIETIAKSNGLWYREDPDTGVVRIMSSSEYERDLVLFRDEQTKVFTLLYPNALDIALAIRNLYGNRVRFQIDRDQQAEVFQELSERFRRFERIGPIVRNIPPAWVLAYRR